MLRTPFKHRAHYVFDYKPRFYNPRKERLDQLKKEIEAENNSETSYSLGLSRTNLKEHWQRTKSDSSDKNTTIRLAVILSILVGIVAWLFELHTLL
jgi:hypothetical protein